MVPPKKRQLNWTQLHILKHSQAMFCRDSKGELRGWCQSSWGLQAAYATFLIMSLVPTATVKLNCIMIPIVALPSFCLTTISDIVSVFVHLIPCSLQWPQVFDPPISPDFSQWAQLCHIKLSQFQRACFFLLWPCENKPHYLWSQSDRVSFWFSNASSIRVSFTLRSGVWESLATA